MWTQQEGNESTPVGDNSISRIETEIPRIPELKWWAIAAKLTYLHTNALSSKRCHTKHRIDSWNEYSTSFTFIYITIYDNIS